MSDPKSREWPMRRIERNDERYGNPVPDDMIDKRLRENRNDRTPKNDSWNFDF